MDMVKVTGAYKLKKLNTLIVVLMILVLAVNEDERYFEYSTISIRLYGALFIFSILLMLVLELVLMEVHYDREQLMIKHMMYKKEISMEDISSVSYSFKWRKKGYTLVLKIKHKGGTFFMADYISAREREGCINRTINKPTLTLYNFIEAEYPEKAKGYWRFCGF